MNGVIGKSMQKGHFTVPIL